MEFDVPTIVEWLREGDEHSAADLLEQCDIRCTYSDTLFALDGEGEFDKYDVVIHAPRGVLKVIDSTHSLEKEQIESAVREAAGAESPPIVVGYIGWGAKMIKRPEPNSVGSSSELPALDHHRNHLESSRVDFVIVTPIEVERRAVCATLGISASDRERKGNRVYWKKSILQSNGETCNVVIVQSSDQGNVDAATVTTDAIRHWNPLAVLLVGIAGGIEPNQRLGDIVVGRDIFYYERGKQGADGQLPEPKMIPADALLLNNAQSLPDWHLEPEVTRPRVSRRQPLVHFEVIASGEKAIANAEIRDDIAAQDRKLRAVEMEAYGFSRAAFSSFERPRYLVIRSICDMADCNKKDTWHPYAASVVASYVRHFILDGPLESIRKGSN